MRIDWVRVRHVDTGGETDIPARSLERYQLRGWFPLADYEAVVTAEPQPVDTGDFITEENQ